MLKMINPKTVNFIDVAFIQKIHATLNEKLVSKLGGEPGDIIHFRSQIPYGHYKISRMSKGKLYYQNSNIPLDWNFVDSKLIKFVLDQIVQNEFYVYRKLPHGNGHISEYAKTWIKNDKAKLSS